MSSWISPELFKDMQPPAKRKKSNATNKSKLKSETKTLSKKNLVLKTSANWLDNFNPETEADLAVHSKKVQEVKDWILKATNSTKKGNILLLTGPTGSGKTATVQVLCKDLGITLNEWVTPVDTERYIESRSYGNKEYAIVDKQSDVFLQFLLKASRYKSLFDGEDKGRIVVVEDFPNYLLRNPEAIEDILKKYKEWGKSPLIFICTEAVGKDINISRNIFTDSVREQFRIDHISFNPVATTGLKNALKRAVSILSQTDSRYKLQTTETIDAIVYSSIGDIRSALNNLCFSSLKESLSVELEPVIEQQAWTLQTPRGSVKTKAAKQKCNKLKNMGRDETLGLLHGVGRVMNPKRVMTMYGYTFSHPIEETSESFMTMAKTFIGFLHQNYPSHFRCIEDISLASEYLSLADGYCQEWGEKDCSEFALWFAIGGLQVSNLEPVKHWAPVRAPKKIQVNIPTCRDLGLDLHHTAHRKSLATDYKTYCRIIKPSLKPEVCIEDDDEDDIDVIDSD